MAETIYEIYLELQETNRLLTTILALKHPIHPTVEELGLVDRDDDDS